MNAYRVAIVVWVALLALLAVNVALAALAASPLANALSLACAVAMVALIFTVYMGLTAADGLLRVVALGGFVWLAIMLTLILLDFLTDQALY